MLTGELSKLGSLSFNEIFQLKRVFGVGVPIDCESTLRRGIISRSKFRYSHANLRSCWNVRLEQLFILILRSASSGASALVQTCPSALFRSIRSNRHSLAVVSDHSVGSIPVQAQVSFAETVPFIRYHFTGYHFIKRRYFLLDF